MQAAAWFPEGAAGPAAEVSEGPLADTAASAAAGLAAALPPAVPNVFAEGRSGSSVLPKLRLNHGLCTELLPSSASLQQELQVPLMGECSIGQSVSADEQDTQAQQLSAVSTGGGAQPCDSPVAEASGFTGSISSETGVGAGGFGMPMGPGLFAGPCGFGMGHIAAGAFGMGMAAGGAAGAYGVPAAVGPDEHTSWGAGGYLPQHELQQQPPQQLMQQQYYKGAAQMLDEAAGWHDQLGMQQIDVDELSSDELLEQLLAEFAA